MSNPKSYPLERSEEEWKNQLDEQSYRILIEKGTEYPFTGEYNDHFEKEFTAVRAVEHRSTGLKTNLIVPVAGPVMTKPYPVQ